MSHHCYLSVALYQIAIVITLQIWAQMYMKVLSIYCDVSWHSLHWQEKDTDNDSMVSSDTAHFHWHCRRTFAHTSDRFNSYQCYKRQTFHALCIRCKRLSSRWIRIKLTAMWSREITLLISLYYSTWQTFPLSSPTFCHCNRRSLCFSFIVFTWQVELAHFTLWYNYFAPLTLACLSLSHLRKLFNLSAINVSLSPKSRWMNTLPSVHWKIDEKSICRVIGRLIKHPRSPAHWTSGEMEATAITRISGGNLTFKLRLLVSSSWRRTALNALHYERHFNISPAM